MRFLQQLLSLSVKLQEGSGLVKRSNEREGDFGRVKSKLGYLGAGVYGTSHPSKLRLSNRW